ncbi:selenide, water dikinase SelD, partial [candidate division GN15 bacterium]|nr:selenide, water dikinase SelD [candidate division GN15 bacterium]
MADALKSLPVTEHPDLLVGYNKADDAGVFRISDTQALVQTVDFFPPIVDDPYAFGQIAAANALSDVYAMGGRPVTALNIVGFPKGALDVSILTDILCGGCDKIAEAEAVVVGGHSINDKELKYGVSVTGLIDPNRIVTNSGARPDDVLFLTKRLGTGLITTGIKREKVDDRVAQAAIEEMARLNRRASELMIAHGAHAATDITGYGLMGHALEMAAGSEVTLHLISSA